MIKECPKVAAKEAKKKEAGMAVVQMSPTLMLNLPSANVVPGVRMGICCAEQL